MIILGNGDLHDFCQPFEADIHTIAYALAHINRFTGHVGQYSVAQHSVLLSEQLPPQLQLSGLLHDGTEAFIGDVSAPLKRLLPDYRAIKQWYHDEIDRQFGVNTTHADIKTADLRMLVTEALAFGFPLQHFPEFEPYHSLAIERWDPEYAAHKFLNQYELLTRTAL